MRFGLFSECEHVASVLVSVQSFLTKHLVNTCWAFPSPPKIAVLDFSPRAKPASTASTAAAMISAFREPPYDPNMPFQPRRKNTGWLTTPQKRLLAYLLGLAAVTLIIVMAVRSGLGSPGQEEVLQIRRKPVKVAAAPGAGADSGAGAGAAGAAGDIPKPAAAGAEKVLIAD